MMARAAYNAIPSVSIAFLSDASRGGLHIHSVRILHGAMDIGRQQMTPHQEGVFCCAPRPLGPGGIPRVPLVSMDLSLERDAGSAAGLGSKIVS